MRITAAENANGEVIRVLRSQIEPTRVETGCISCSLYKDLYNPSIIVWMEEWKTQADLERHLNSPQYKKVLAVFDMSSTPPDLCFNTVVKTKGLQLIAEARGRKNLK
jgi:quinol monooxygenase YgiN